MTSFSLPLIICAIFGVANFYLHKAAIESGHPFVEDTKYYFGRHFGTAGSYIIEFVILTTALSFVSTSAIIVMLLYGGYTMFNGIAAYLLLTGRI
jgi:hypothetical protein